MDLYTMEYVVSVSERRSFSLAAQDRGVTQSALSQQIAKLEDELGVVLFLRNSKGVALTEAGESFVHRAREILQHTEALRAEMSLYAGVRKGTLNIGTITSLRCIDFGGMLSAFCASCPDASVNIVQGGTRSLVKLLLDRKIDLAFINRPAADLHPGLEFFPLGQDVYSLAVPAQHPLAGRGRVSIRELKEERFIFHQTEQVAAELCLSACRRAGFEPDIVCRSADPTASLYMVRSRLGVALLPTEEFRDRSIDGVVEVKLRERIVKQVGVTRRRDLASPLADAAVRFAQDWVR